MNEVDLAQKTQLLSAPTQEQQVAFLVRELLATLGEDPERQGLQRTPERVARAANELLAGYHTDPVALINDALFDSDYDQAVVVRDIEFYSLCEHHLLPFFGHAAVAYIPDGRVLGLSKIPRAVEMFARRLQIQERMTQEIADFMNDVLHPRGVAVVVEAAHMCAMMRGVKKSETRMLTSAVLGVYKNDSAARAEIMAQLQGQAARAV